MQKRKSIYKFVCHSYRVVEEASKYDWLPGAKYTNLRDVRKFSKLGFLDIDWNNYDFGRHLEAAKETKPLITIAQDVEDRSKLSQTLDQAYILKEYCDHVLIVPKDVTLSTDLEEQIPKDFLFGFSVPTKYGGTNIDPMFFKRPTHLLGGRPEVQRALAEKMPVFSIDGNRFTLDASFGDYFDGERFRPHPVGGYRNCISDSIRNIDNLWNDYSPSESWSLQNDRT